MNSTIPKPRDFPVVRSVMTRALSTIPTEENFSFRSASMTSNDRLPTNTFFEMGPSVPRSGAPLLPALPAYMPRTAPYGTVTDAIRLRHA